jgi:hypothetical protein
MYREILVYKIEIYSYNCISTVENYANISLFLHGIDIV